MQYVNQRLQIQLELLMMSSILLKTCWAFNEQWNNKFCYKVASCWLFLLNHTTMHGSMNIKSTYYGLSHLLTIPSILHIYLPPEASTTVCVTKGLSFTNWLCLVLLMILFMQQIMSWTFSKTSSHDMKRLIFPQWFQVGGSFSEA